MRNRESGRRTSPLSCARAPGQFLSLPLPSPPGPTIFPPGACDRLEAHLGAHLVGQGLAVRQLTDAVCDHAARLEGKEGLGGSALPPKPLVLSAHGPPGVGKTLAAALTASALFAPPGRDPADPAWACPGRACPAHRVFFGLDFGGGAAGEAQLAAARRALASHAAAFPAGLIVVEEYDKLDCRARGLFRTMLAGSGGGGGSGGSVGGRAPGWTGGGANNASSSSPPSLPPMPDLSRSIVLLESNTGYAHLAAALAAATEGAAAAAESGRDPAAAAVLAADGDGRALLAPETAARLLKDAVYETWAADGCESPADTVRALAAVDWFLPFLPLHLSHVKTLLARRLADRAARAEAEAGLRLVWDDGVIDFLAARVDVGEPLGLGGQAASPAGALYPIEGGREVGPLVTRYVTRAVREAGARLGGGASVAAGQPLPVRRGTLVVADDGRGLEVRVEGGGGPAHSTPCASSS